MFALAGHLGMTVGELSRRMDSRELTEWMAYTRYYQALPDPWRQTGLEVSAMLAPHSPRGKCPSADDFNPIEKAPQHGDQMLAQIKALQAALGGG
jgi:hypothetical protein